MLAWLDDLWKHAYIETASGNVPGTSHEVAGEMMQTRSCRCWMTDEDFFKEGVYLLASNFLDYHLATKEEKLSAEQVRRGIPVPLDKEKAASIPIRKIP